MTRTAGDFEVNLPEYADTADIRKTMSLYHYGTESVPNPDDPLQENSVAYFLDNVLTTLEQAQNRLSVVPKLESSDDLNQIFNNGLFLSVDTPQLDRNYPVAARGILSVISVENNLATFQTYQTVNNPNNFYWRSSTVAGGQRTWSSWKEASSVGHTHPEYLTGALFNSKVDSNISASRAAITDSSGRLTASPVTSSELAQLDGVSLGQTVQDQLNDKAPLSHNHDTLYYRKTEQPRIFVQSTTPSGASVGDLWFW